MHRCRPNFTEAARAAVAAEVAAAVDVAVEAAMAQDVAGAVASRGAGQWREAWHMAVPARVAAVATARPCCLARPHYSWCPKAVPLRWCGRTV